MLSQDIHSNLANGAYDFKILLVIFVLLAGSTRVLASGPGTSSVGWLTVVGSERVTYAGGSPLYDSGYVQVFAGDTVIYNYGKNDTPESIATNVAALFNSNSLSVTAWSTGNVVTVTSKTTGSAANFHLSAIYGTYDPNDFSPSFQTSTIGMTGGRDGARNFPMVMYTNGVAAANADLPFVAAPIGVTDPPSTQIPQPIATTLAQVPGHSILGIAPGVAAWFPQGSAQVWTDAITQNNYDLTRVDAVNVDEPYLQLISYLYEYGLLKGGPMCDLSCEVAGDPCAPGDVRRPYILQAYNQLQALAAAIKQTSPRTRFWVNFESAELQWMQNGSCANMQISSTQSISLNGPYIDVVSLDEYIDDFVTTVRPKYDWLLAHPGYSGQQLALVPGAFVHPSGVGSSAIAQAQILEEYFDYATTMNRSCNLPLGNTGVTGVFDGCPVWLVAGFLYQSTQDCPSCQPFLGLADPAAGPVQAAWLAELSKPAMPKWWVGVNYLLSNN